MQLVSHEAENDTHVSGKNERRLSWRPDRHSMRELFVASGTDGSAIQPPVSISVHSDQMRSVIVF